MFPQTYPQTALLSGTVTWSDGTLFDGYVLLALGLPSNGDGVWPTAMIGGKYPATRIPVWTVVPIIRGVFSPNTSIFFNSSIDPPGTKYGAYWYDINWRLLFPAVGVPATGFTISVNPYAISIPTLTVPSSPSTIPLPQTTPSTGSPLPGPYSTPMDFTLADGTILGAADGSNTAFTLSQACRKIDVRLNGVSLAPNYYTFVTGTQLVTFIAPFIPQAGADLYIMGWI